MPHEYTRQRQGRDFSLQKYLMKAAAKKRSEEENAKTHDDAEKTLFQRLEQYKEEAERNAVPVDGDEPTEMRGPNTI